MSSFINRGIAYDNDILNEVDNPRQAEFNLDTGEAFLFVYYQKNTPFELDITDLPEGWIQLCTNLEGYTMWETQFIGPLGLTTEAKSVITSKLQTLQNEGSVGEWRIRYNYPPSENTTESDEEDDIEFFNRYNNYNNGSIPPWLRDTLDME
jgi:hypothetical protein